MPKQQFLIAVDQTFNTMIRDYPGGPHGWADETISARCWRLSQLDRTLLPGHRDMWERRRRRVDKLFALLTKQQDHCYLSYISELQRRQSPPATRIFAPEN